jgi:hypothetical protein
MKKTKTFPRRQKEREVHSDFTLFFVRERIYRVLLRMPTRLAVGLEAKKSSAFA